MTGAGARLRRRYTGPSISAAANTAFSVSTASQTERMVMPGMARTKAMSVLA